MTYLKLKSMVRSLIVLGMILLCAATANAAYLSINAGADNNTIGAGGGRVYNQAGIGAGHELAVGSVIQYIYAGSDGAINPPATDGDKTGDDVILSTRSVGDDTVYLVFSHVAGQFYHSVTGTYTSGSPKVYVRAWNSSSIATATHYGNSALVDPAVNPSVPPLPTDVGLANFATTLTKPVAAATITRTPATVAVTITEGEDAADATFQVGNSGSASLSYTLTESATWITSIAPATGSVAVGAANNTHTIHFSTAALTTADSPYTANISIADTKATNSPQTVAVTVTVNAPAHGTLQFNPTTYTRSEDGTSATITVTRTGGTDGAVGVHYATSNGTATAGSDYTAASGDLSWAEGESASKTFTVTILNDTVAESDETVNLTLSAATGGATLGTHSATLTITDDGDVPLDVTPPTISETIPDNGETNVTLTQTISITFSEPMDIDSVSIACVPNPTGGFTAGTWSGGNRTVAFTHTTPFINSTAYDITVTGQDVAGNDLSGDTDFGFTTIAPDSPTIEHVYRKVGEAATTTDSWGYVYNNIDIKGHNFGDDPGSINRSTLQNHVTLAGLTIPTNQVYYWSDTSIVVGIPQTIEATNIVAGAKAVIVTHDTRTSNSLDFTVRPYIYGLVPDTGAVGDPVTINGTALGANIPNVAVSFNGTEATVSTVNHTSLVTEVPAGATSGPLTVTVNGQPSNTPSFTVVGATEPVVTGINPNQSEQGQTLTVTISGTNTNWSGDLASSVTFSGTGITVNSASATNATTVSANITIAAGATVGARTVTVTGASGSATFTVNAKTAPTPVISGVLPASAYVGQTIVINGANLGTQEGTSTITIGGVTGHPTAWGENQITLAVPAGVSGTAAIAITVNGVTGNTANLIITSGGVVIEDFEGGCVDNWEFDYTGDGTADSGYYVFENVADITPDDAHINTDLRQAAAAKHGSQGARVKYSYVGTDGSDWGGGWGAQLANTLNLDPYDTINFFVNWDGSENDVKLTLKDSKGTAYFTTISHLTLASTVNYGQIIRHKSDFAFDADDPANVTGTIDWGHIVSYNFAYITKNTSPSYHTLDSITAGSVNLGGTSEVQPIISGEVIVTSIDPSAAPAGAKFKAMGSGFGAAQGQSLLIFENQSSHKTYSVNVNTWSDTQIEAIVPTLAPAGVYTLKVAKIAISAGTIQAFESNAVGFQVTANAAGGGAATVFPNPFNPLSSVSNKANVTIAYSTGGAANIGIYIYDMTGRLVLHDTTTASQTTWNGKDTQGSYVGDGVYLIRIANEDTKGLIAKARVLVIKQ
ncbi:hypothetical protein COT42_06040 [Candidatus Saganbacteria bacterium CG08_land_8_20_14_0_20_45_16]|uniref:Calx-beta domain-containing protein n=1 Tax=Candidatus Saganbacteria bacterium CG08_land_8_20_14_0_20_45_16 TaxID=2014293 RepID=A0A2H0XYE9_UNCSA|nr:MAG: hypothetical protein COT42_06040 [Candidatus Saganbacteria bacterium CG08_land_8_20_14_0_20_45_16]